MVFESIVTDLMNRFLGDFIENLDKKQLNIGIWGGTYSHLLYNSRTRCVGYGSYRFFLYSGQFWDAHVSYEQEWSSEGYFSGWSCCLLNFTCVTSTLWPIWPHVNSFTVFLLLEWCNNNIRKIVGITALCQMRFRYGRNLQSEPNENHIV